MTFPSKDKPAPVIMMGSEGKRCKIWSNDLNFNIAWLNIAIVLLSEH